MEKTLNNLEIALIHTINLGFFKPREDHKRNYTITDTFKMSITPNMFVL